MSAIQHQAITSTTSVKEASKQLPLLLKISKNSPCCHKHNPHGGVQISLLTTKKIGSKNF